VVHVLHVLHVLPFCQNQWLKKNRSNTCNYVLV